MQNRKTIGIVGGVGPMAGIDLNTKIFELSPMPIDQNYLNVLLFTLPYLIPDRTDFLLGKIDQNPAFGITNVLIRLSNAGADVACVPCNTAHSPKIWEVIKENLKKKKCTIQLINMIDAVVGDVLKNNSVFKKVGILATTGTVKTNIYGEAFYLKNIEYIYPDDHEQEKVHDAIYNLEYGVKAQSVNISKIARTKIYNAIDHLIKKGANIIVLGCTELPLVVKEKKYQKVAIIDSSLVLARAAIAGTNN